jgi:RNA polymerase-associated protein LEO1
MYHLELPKILHLVPYPFDPTVPLPGPESEDFMHPLSTIRHRKTTEGARSNARFLKWSDGSTSLVLGAEMYDIPIHQVPKSEQQFLVMSHHEAGLLRVAKRVDATMKVVPMSTSSEAHRRLVTKQMGGKSVPVEKRGTKEFQPDGDPEALKKIAEKALEDKIRSRKKLESKRKATTIRYGGLGMRSERLDEDDHQSAQVSVGRYDDEGDGFVVSDDDEEEEEKAGRLSRIKSQGTQKYRDRKREDSEDEGDLNLDDESLDDEEDEKVASTPQGKKQQDTPRKSRRRIVDDEDED